jgi:hypothetical protein
MSNGNDIEGCGCWLVLIVIILTAGGGYWMDVFGIKQYWEQARDAIYGPPAIEDVTVKPKPSPRKTKAQKELRQGEREEARIERLEEIGREAASTGYSKANATEQKTATKTGNLNKKQLTDDQIILWLNQKWGSKYYDECRKKCPDLMKGKELVKYLYAINSTAINKKHSDNKSTKSDIEDDELIRELSPNIKRKLESFKERTVMLWQGVGLSQLDMLEALKNPNRSQYIDTKIRKQQERVITMVRELMNVIVKDYLMEQMIKCGRRYAE